LRHPNIDRVYPDRLFCNTTIAGRCVTHDSTNAYYRDDDHLSEVGARMLLHAILERPAFATSGE